MANWQGVYPAVLTQFRADESLDIAATQTEIDRLVGDGIDGVVALGTSGENFTLDEAEKRVLLAAIVETVAGRVPVLAGIAECSTRAGAALAAEAEAMGADGLMVVPGLVYRSGRAEILAHFRAITEASALPVMIYNNPGTYGSDMAPDVIAELAGDARFIAAKESSGELARCETLHETLGEGFAIFCGADDIVLDMVAAGAVGWISGFVNAFPRESVAMFHAAREGREREARALFDWFAPILALDSRPTLVQCLKLVASLQGRGTAAVRGPRLAMDDAEAREVAGIVEAAMASRPALAEPAAAE
jgi:1-pyrroline-4-hydroxy-2-carboxylate deaminase